MGRSPIQEPREAAGAHLLLYDGACGLCNRLVQFVLVHDHRTVFNFASLQSPIGQTMVERFGGDPRDLSSFYVVAYYRTSRMKAVTKSRAAVLVAGELGWPWKALGAAGFFPTAALDTVYDLVARNRYRIFGRSETCLVPAPHFRNRFVE